MIIIPVTGQTVFDLALQHYGSLEGLRYLIEDNIYGADSILTVSDIDTREVLIRDEDIDKSVVDFFDGKTLIST